MPIRKIPTKRRTHSFSSRSSFRSLFSSELPYFRRSHCISSSIYWNSWYSFGGHLGIGNGGPIIPNFHWAIRFMIDSCCFCFLLPLVWILDCDLIRAGSLWEPFDLIRRETYCLRREKWRFRRIRRVWFLLWRPVCLLGQVLSWRRKDLSVPELQGPEQVCDYDSRINFYIYFLGLVSPSRWIEMLDFWLSNVFVGWMQSDPFWICSFCIVFYVLLGGKGSFFQVNLCQNFWVSYSSLWFFLLDLSILGAIYSTMDSATQGNWAFKRMEALAFKGWNWTLQ